MQTTTTTDQLDGSPPETLAIMFNTVSGVDIRADVTAPYNTFGVSVRPRGPVLPEFMNVLEDYVEDLQRLAARRIDALVLCSVWRAAKPGERFNRHAEGRAIDIGGVWWKGQEIERQRVAAWDYNDDRKRSIAVEAVARMHFGTVLGPASNKAHAHHWHVDTGKEPEITERELQQSEGGERKIEVVALQDACRVVHGIDVGKLDGRWGPKTDAGVSRVLEGLDVDTDLDIISPATYQAFNLATALVGFGIVETPIGTNVA